MIIFSVNKYSFVDEKSGEVNSGATVWFIDPASANEIGMISPIKSTISVDLANKLLANEFPFLAEVKQVMRAGANARATLQITDIKFIKPFKLMV